VRGIPKISITPKERSIPKRKKLLEHYLTPKSINSKDGDQVSYLLSREDTKCVGSTSLGKQGLDESQQPRTHHKGPTCTTKASWK